jgi:ribosomal protein S18 acetylase RimI-like enzyme
MSAPLRRATSSDVPALAQVLAAAFADDPFYDWLLPRGARRAPAFLEVFELILRRMSHELSETYTTPDAKGVALWLPPGKHQLSLVKQAQLLPGFARVLGWRRIPPGLRLIQHMDLLHARFAPSPHIYLSVLGVHPSRQGQGVGGELLRPMLERCDAEGLAVYLETASEPNVAFYERQGFELRRREEHAQFPTLWAMARAPR